jgi:hypothetical protein
MSTIAWPANLTPRSASMRLQSTQRVHASPFGGSEQVVDLLNDRWMLSLELNARGGFDEGAKVEAFLAAMRGQSNIVALWHFARPNVRGTLTSATCASVAQGASAVVLTGGGTLKAGDMLGISGLLLQVASDVTVGSGTSVPIVNRLRTAVSGAVTLVKPTANFRLASPNASVMYSPCITEAVSIDFAEAI